jgi:hypothetical protein
VNDDALAVDIPDLQVRDFFPGCTRDYVLVSQSAQARDIEARIEQLILDTPTVSIKGLVEQTGRKEWEVRKTIQKLGYARQRGGKKGATQWVKASLPTIQVCEPDNTAEDQESEPDVDFGDQAA